MKEDDHNRGTSAKERYTKGLASLYSATQRCPHLLLSTGHATIVVKGLKRNRSFCTEPTGRRKFAITPTADRLLQRRLNTRDTFLSPSMQDAIDDNDDDDDRQDERMKGIEGKGEVEEKKKKKKERIAESRRRTCETMKAERHELAHGQSIMGTYGVKACVVLWRPLEDMSRLASTIARLTKESAAQQDARCVRVRAEFYLFYLIRPTTSVFFPIALRSSGFCNTVTRVPD